MKEDKLGIEKFKEDMGFKDCSEAEYNPPSDNEYIGRGKEKVVSKCINYKEQEYECSMIIDSESKKVIKSNCEKILEKND